MYYNYFTLNDYTKAQLPNDKSNKEVHFCVILVNLTKSYLVVTLSVECLIDLSFRITFNPQAKMTPK